MGSTQQSALESDSIECPRIERSSSGHILLPIPAENDPLSLRLSEEQSTKVTDTKNDTKQEFDSLLRTYSVNSNDETLTKSLEGKSCKKSVAAERTEREFPNRSMAVLAAHEDDLVNSMPDIARSVTNLANSLNRINSVAEPRSGNAKLGEEPDTLTHASSRRDALIILLQAILCNMLFGMHYVAFSIYYVAITESFGVSKFTSGFVGSVFGAAQNFVGIFISPALQIFGCRPPMIIGGSVVSVSLVLSAFAPNVYTLYITYGFLGGCGCGAILLSSVVEVQQNFGRNRALAQGISMIGFSIGQMSGSSVISLLLENFGWRGTMLVNGAIFAHMIPVGLTFGRTRLSMANLEHNRALAPKGLKAIVSEMFNFSLLKETNFLLYCFSLFVFRIGNTSFIFHTPSRAVFIGMSLKEGALLFLIMGPCVIGGRVICAFVSNLKCVNRILLYSLGMFISAIANLMLILAVTFLGTALLSVGAGIGFGIANTLTITILSDLFGADIIMRSSAVSSLFQGTAHLVGTPFAGWLFDVTHDYDISFLVIGFCLLTASLLTFLIFVMEKVKSNKRTTNNNEEMLPTV